MSDVVKRADDGNSVKNGGFVISACPVFGNTQSEELDYYQNPPISGVNGVTDVPWQDRFDDTQYYST